MTPELTDYLKQIAETATATDRLFGQVGASVAESDILSVASKMRDLSDRLQQFEGEERRMAARHLGDALERIDKNRDAAERRWNNERQA